MPRKKTASRSTKLAETEIRTEMHHMRSGKHPIASRKQAIAIGLSKARQKGARIPRKGASAQ
jgi:hypothetical protein